MDKRDISRVSVLWASVEHAAELAKHHAALSDVPWSSQSFAGSLSHPGATSFIARVGMPKETVGFIIGQLAADEAELLQIGVVKTWQRSGLGRKLIDGLVRAATKAEAKRVHLEVAADNAPAIALYRATGFVETGRRKGYYVKQGAAPVDALLMARDLG